MIFEKKRHREKEIFDISELFIQCNKDSCSEHITGSINIYLYGCDSLLVPECVVSFCVYVFLCVRYQSRVPTENHIMCQTSVNLMPCCIKYTARFFWYKVTKAQHV